MKLWVTTGEYPEWVWLYCAKPDEWNAVLKHYNNKQDFSSLRLALKFFMRGIGKRLPRHGTKQIVEIELTVK